MSPIKAAVRAARRHAVELLVATPCLFLGPGHGDASAWLQPQGHAQVITTFTYHSSRGSFDDKGNSVTLQYQRFELAPYIEYGAATWLTLGAEPRYQWAQSGSGAARQTSDGMGDVDVFARVPLLKFGPWVTSIQGTAIFADVYDRLRRPAPGTGRDAYEARLLVGRNLSPRSASHFNLEAGYRMGQAGVADQIRFDGALGLKRWRRWLFLQEIFITQSIGDGDGVPGHAYDLTKLRSSAVYSLTEHLGIQAGYERDIAGSGVSLGDTGLVAIWAQF